jgi:tRNA(Ile)-lysidine synthase
MNIVWPAPARYLLAVSGGADSMALLDLMVRSGSYELVVGHYDHGLRPDSGVDAEAVAAAARAYGIAYTRHTAGLGQASEAEARRRRYEWLEHTRREQGAHAIVTAHHRDDLLETSLLNLARGSGRRGLAPMQSGPVVRPLLGVSRAELRAYIATHGVTWRDDPTNADLANPRNFVRHRLLPAAPGDWTARYLDLIHRQAELNQAIDGQLPPGTSWPRRLIRDLSLPEVAELIHAAARRLDPAVQPDIRLLRELALFAKTARPHRRRPINGRLSVAAGRDTISVLSF